MLNIILGRQMATILMFTIVLAAAVGCNSVDKPSAAPEPTPTVGPLSSGQVGISLDLQPGWLGSGTIASDIELMPGDEFTVVVNADTNGEVVTAGQIELNWDASALAALEYTDGGLIGSAPLGGYELTGPHGVLQGGLRYTVWDQELPGETPSGVLAKFKFRVVDDRFGKAEAEEGTYSITLANAGISNDRVELTSVGDERLRFERPGIEACRKPMS